MAKKNAASPVTVYQIKVTLGGTKPLIWRRLLVPSNLAMDDPKNPEHGDL